MSSRATLERKDREASEGKVLRKESKLFPMPEVKRRDIGYMKRYENILEKNRLLFVTDLIKEMLQEAFSCQSEHRMLEYVNRIMDLCLECAPGEDERNRHLMWFRKLLASHLDGIIAHAT